MRSDRLATTEPPWVWIDLITEDDPNLIESAFYELDGVAAVVRKLRGNKMKRLQGLMDEFGAALQFFDGFGENWNALSECLCYMDEWLPAEAYVLVISNPIEVLAEQPDQKKWLLKTFDEVGSWWSRPITDNDRFNRPPIPFHVVLQCGRETLDQVQTGYPGVPVLPVMRSTVE